MLYKGEQHFIRLLAPELQPIPFTRARRKYISLSFIAATRCLSSQIICATGQKMKANSDLLFAQITTIKEALISQRAEKPGKTQKRSGGPASLSSVI